LPNEKAVSCDCESVML